ncbi:hypothetical protein [Cellulomonas xiejunii]|uniref:hypothetical protein n=1 Tax=Cellulomonas xiejunii TaxID=2968083 RepID=UPI001D0E588B|nr:hypothetical protein [Cellulomonas xiejunii]MCC2313629.1 hypothetical protein [Cellulomonas xiejunii]
MVDLRSGAEMTVSEAARAAALSPARVRALVNAGRVPSRKVGNQHLVDVNALLAMPRRPGRPMSPRMAWALLLLTDDQRPEWVAPGDVYRVERHLDRLASDPAPELLLQALVRNRATRHAYGAQAPDGLRHDDQLVLSGLSDSRAGLAAAADVEAYVQDDDLRGVVRRHLLVAASDARANVWLHSAPFVPPSSLRLQVAADLAEHGGPRERQRARDIIRAAVEGRR